MHKFYTHRDYLTHKKWGIVCPGPSLQRDKTNLMILEDSPDWLVAVNGAIMANHDFDHWVVSDVEVFRSCLKEGLYLAGQTELICPQNWSTAFDSRWEEYRIYINHPKTPFPANNNRAFCEFYGLSNIVDINWRESTMRIAIAMALARGAKEINIYGADLDGKGYFRPRLENERTIHTPDRWRVEREQLDKIMHLAGAAGVKINHREE